jgi:exopolysaccharide biosynthesis WecB/TagA/CpsF family protein
MTVPATLAPPAPPTEVECTEILGIPVVCGEAVEVLPAIADRLADGGSPTSVFFANAHALNLTCRVPEFQAAMRDADFVLNDGIGVAIAGRLKGCRFPENLNGSDLTPAMLHIAAVAGQSAYFLGARPGVAERAAARLSEEMHGLVVAGCRDGYFSPEETEEVIEEIRESGAGLLLVAMGNPRQELWLREHLEATGARVGVAVGAFFDFAAGTARRAPGWMNRWGMEWLWRLAREPRRLANRYLIGNPLFLYRVVVDAIRPRPRVPREPRLARGHMT